MQHITRRSFLTLVGTGIVSAGLTACGSTRPALSGSMTGSDAGSAARSTHPEVIRVASLKGPTSIGLAHLIKLAQDGKTEEPYQFTMYTSPSDEVLPLLVKGEVDIATLPANVASVAYAKTKGAVKVIDINTLGVLYMVTASTDITSLADLGGHTLYVTNKGATPDYVTHYLLAKNNLSDTVTIEYKDEPTELVSSLAANADAVGVLPEPFVTAATTKNEALHVIADLTEEWATVAEEGSQLVTGVTVARSEFVSQYPEAISQFLSDHATSVDMVTNDPETYGHVVSDLGIVDAAPIATKAIPQCNLVCITGEEMRSALEGYLQVLFDADPSAVGGTMPDNKFYYEN